MDFDILRKEVPPQLNKAIVLRCAGSKPEGKVSIGFGLGGNIGEEMAGLNAERILLITSPVLVNLNIVDVVMESLREKEYEFDTFSGVEAEPTIEVARQIQEMVRATNYSTIIGLGGGSVLDMAKVASLMATNPGDIEEYMTGRVLVNEGLPSVLVPTTSGTGSEVSPFIVITKGDEKLFVKHHFSYPTIALVDPLLTVTMPPSITASTGLDALSHGVEGLLANQNPVTEALSIKCVECVFQYLERACGNSFDLEARYYMSYASVLGMLSYSLGGGLYAHSMSYILASCVELPHGMGCGLALPYTLDFNYDYIKPILAKFSDVIKRDAEHVDVVDGMEAPARVIHEFQNLTARVNVPDNLKILGIEEQRISDLAKDLRTKYYRDSNPRPLGEVESLQLVRSMWEGSIREMR